MLKYCRFQTPEFFQTANEILIGVKIQLIIETQVKFVFNESISPWGCKRYNRSSPIYRVAINDGPYKVQWLITNRINLMITYQLLKTDLL